MLKGLLALACFASQAIPPPANSLFFNKPTLAHHQIEAFRCFLQTVHDEIDNQKVLLLGNHVSGLAGLLQNSGMDIWQMTSEAFVFNATWADDAFMDYVFAVVVLPEELELSRALAKELERRVSHGGLLFIAYISTGFEQSLFHRGFERMPVTFEQFAISGLQDKFGRLFHIYRKSNGHVTNYHRQMSTSA